tara:strand:- start:74 stop:349 length:276 start_codon:yes stop_codon:yes gene_type:complete
MCIRFGSPDPAPLPQKAPIMARNPDLTEASRLPDKKELFDEDDVTSVEYGSSKKEGGAAAGKKTGAKALRIPLNTGVTQAAGTGGVTGGTG